ncbi:TetR/AcrR family transcriptional regulator [Xanthobacter sp. KR7-65]|uniref:TetR/AcrR family transcriptional regulator n=1 Tax=Xanthobacter sp. KR7-65 TaxID=3156612 RepID=UPI0032B37FB2
MTGGSSTSTDILDCARALIIAGGYNGFSYANIAEVIGIRKASIHHHFPTKLDLVCTLVSRYRAEAAKGLATLEQAIPDPLEQLRAYSGYWEACIADAQRPFCLYALLATQIPVLPEPLVLEIRAYFHVLSGWLTQVLQRGVQQGIFHLAGEAKAEAEIFMASVHGAMLSARAYGDPRVFGAIVNPMIQRLASPPAVGARS